MPKNEKKTKNLDDLLEEVTKTPHHKIDESLTLYDTHMSEEVQLKHFNELFAPSQDEMYAAVKKQLDEIFKSDTAKLHEKQEELQKAIVEGLKAYFNKAQPSVLKGLEELESLEDQYRFLTTIYDKQHLGSEKPVLGVLAEGLAKDKKLTVGHLKKMLWAQKAEHAQQAQERLNALARTHYLGTIPQHELARYLKPKIEEAGYTIEDKLQYLLQPHDILLKIRAGIEKGEWPEHGYRVLGLEKKKKEKKDEK